MLQTCGFTINEHYHKLFFKAFDHKSATTTSYHILLHNNYFCRVPLESCFCACKIWEVSQSNKKCSILPINNCTKKLHCGSANFSKCLQNLSGTTTCKNIFFVFFIILLFIISVYEETERVYFCIV